MEGFKHGGQGVGRCFVSCRYKELLRHFPKASHPQPLIGRLLEIKGHGMGVVPLPELRGTKARTSGLESSMMALNMKHVEQEYRTAGCPVLTAAVDAWNPSSEQINMVHRHPGLLVSRTQKSHIPSFHPDRSIDLSFPLCKKIPFTPSLRSFLTKCNAVLFPCCNDQIVPFPEHARWTIHMCQHGHPGTRCPSGAPQAVPAT